MLSRPFQFLPLALAALATLILRLPGSSLGPAGTMGARGAENGGVVFRHYL